MLNYYCDHPELHKLIEQEIFEPMAKESQLRKTVKATVVFSGIGPGWKNKWGYHSSITDLKYANHREYGKNNTEEFYVSMSDSALDREGTVSILLCVCLEISNEKLFIDWELRDYMRLRYGWKAIDKHSPRDSIRIEWLHKQPNKELEIEFTISSDNQKTMRPKLEDYIGKAGYIGYERQKHVRVDPLDPELLKTITVAIKPADRLII